MAGDRAAGDVVLIDMHLHTAASFDCLSDPVRVVQTAFSRGMDHVCITDHNEIAAAVRMRERFGPRVIVGEEVKTAEGVDVIGLFLTERIPKGTPAVETCERIHEQGGLVYVPHPFAGGKGAGERVLEQIEGMVDVVEGFNARVHDPRRNGRAREWAECRRLPVGAGSDAHTLREVARAYVRVPSFADDPRALAGALRSATIAGRTSSPAVHLASTWAKLHKRLGGRGRNGAVVENGSPRSADGNRRAG